jgi:nitrogenase molybdenum-iron protein NifN
MSQAAATIELTSTAQSSGGQVLADRFSVPLHRQMLPIGVEQTDTLYQHLEQIAARPAPADHIAERGRLIDAYVDAHKYLHGVRVAIYGEEDLVIALTHFAREIGMKPVLCASGATGNRMAEAITKTDPLDEEPTRIVNGADFADISRYLDENTPDLIIGHSKGYKSARGVDVPLVRVGFPVHDRFGAARILHLGYRGTQQLLDRIVNVLLERKQEQSPVGYTYL